MGKLGGMLVSAPKRLLDRIGHAQVQPLTARQRHVGQECLPDQLVGECKAGLMAVLGPGDEPSPLGSIDGVEEGV